MPKACKYATVTCLISINYINMTSLIDFFSSTLYVYPLLFVASFTTAFVGYYKKNKNPILRFLPIYALLSSLQTLICFCCIFLDNDIGIIISISSIYVFMIIELLIFYNFLLNLLKVKWHLQSINMLKIIFVTLLAYTYINRGALLDVPSELNIINCICIAIPCLFYFQEIFTSAPLTNLSEEPSFWIVTGFLFMAICTLPFYFLQSYISQHLPMLYDQIYLLIAVFYCLLFSLILKAFICNPATSK